MQIPIEFIEIKYLGGYKLLHINATAAAIAAAGIFI